MADDNAAETVPPSQNAANSAFKGFAFSKVCEHMFTLSVIFRMAYRTTYLCADKLCKAQASCEKRGTTRRENRKIGQGRVCLITDAVGFANHAVFVDSINAQTATFSVACQKHPSSLSFRYKKLCNGVRCHRVQETKGMMPRRRMRERLKMTSQRARFWRVRHNAAV
jgi:hypothetical protein